jgi:anthraniloyl-CoA monooxygenase
MKIAVVGGGPGGLYFAILMKKAGPSNDITVYERNRHDDTFGFGVVFSDETLEHFRDYDEETYRAITDAFAYWEEIDFHFGGQVVRATGHGFSGLERKKLLLILQQRALKLRIKLEFGAEISDLSRLQDADLIVGADGINSVVRETYQEHFRPSFEWRKNKFIWLGSTRPLPAFTFHFQQNEHGIWILGAYQYNDKMSTWIVEASEEDWRRAGLDHATESDSVAYLGEVWADFLDGHPLVANRSVWRTFPTIRNERWFHNNVVLIGDALHTAHYSIGSGTKLAMEDAIALSEALQASGTIPAALEQFADERREEVEKMQHAADVSVVWTENVRRFWHMEPIQAAYSMLTRSKQITHENLRLRDPEFVARVERWFAETVRQDVDFDLPHDGPPPPMFTPYRLRDMVVKNRVVVSPMDMYSATDGTPSDFHYVHLGGLALGGAGLVYSEMACVTREGRITPGCAGMYKSEHVVAWKPIIDFVHRESDAKFCMQLGHSGRKGSTRVAWEGMDQPLPAGNWPLISASPIRYSSESQLPLEMDRYDMDTVRGDFVRAAEMSEQAGADMLELHMAHGYLLSSFLSPLTNIRSDEYGGSLEKGLRSGGLAGCQADVGSHLGNRLGCRRWPHRRGRGRDRQGLQGTRM